MKPVVAIIGRPNVGKSSLFNRVLGRRKALVEDVPGVTRDRNYAVAEYDDHEFVLVDTGGIEADDAAPEDRRRLARIIREAAAAAVDEADVLVLLLDGREGLLPGDEELADLVRRSGKPTMVAVNKIDHPNHEPRLAEFYALGFEELLPISATHGLEVDDLMERVVAALPERSAGPDALEPWADEGRRRRPRRGLRPDRLADDMPEEPVTGPPGWRGDAGEGTATGEQGTAEERSGPLPGEGDDDEFTLRVAVMGRPNVGKSTLINALLGFDRCLVSEVAGTTRDSIDTYVELDGRRLILIDTAGIRRRARISERVERMTVQRSLQMIEAAHIVLLLVDAEEGITDQDARLGELADDRGRALLLLVNKWDRVRDRQRRSRELRDEIARKLPHLAYAPWLTVSAKTRKRLDRLLPTLDTVNQAHRTRIETAALNRWLQAAVEAQPPPLLRHHTVKLYYATQVAVRPPRIVIFTGSPDGIPQHYRRYLVNRLRAAFDLEGTPVRLSFRKR